MKPFETIDSQGELTKEQFDFLLHRPKRKVMKTAPKRMFPNGLTTVAAGSVGDGDKRLVTLKGKKTLERGVKKGPYHFEHKSYWDDETKTVRTIRVDVFIGKQKRESDRRRKGKAKFPLPAKERAYS